jgi:hypothetical protein
MEALLLLGILFGLVFLRMPVPFAMLTVALSFILIQKWTGGMVIFSAAGPKIIPQRIPPRLKASRCWLFPCLCWPETC